VPVQMFLSYSVGAGSLKTRYPVTPYPVITGQLRGSRFLVVPATAESVPTGVPEQDEGPSCSRLHRGPVLVRSSLGGFEV
jgi:hypothetical protein